ncbi:MAG: hypothetical protein WB973_06955, partial [Thermoanaerobaculia bacterium]
MNPKHTRLASQAVVFFLILFAFFAAAPVFAQDSVTIGTVTASGNTVDVPVYVRDVSGTPLGRDQAAGSRIQSFSITVDYSPAAAVQSVTFTRAGITAPLSTPSEGSPGTSGTITWFASFDESTNLVPFTLNAPPPGDQIAHLVFTLSSSAAPGSSIALSLGSATVLANQAGTLGETPSGSLTLVNGAINIPNLTLQIVPNSRVIEVNESTTYAVQTNANVGSNTTVTLTSSNPGIAAMPPSVDIAAGSHSANFTVIGSAVGAATITGTLPGGANATAELTVNPATVPCTIPAAPQISAAATASTGSPYSISWAAVSSATDYVVDESTDANFLTITS